MLWNFPSWQLSQLFAFVLLENFDVGHFAQSPLDALTQLPGLHSTQKPALDPPHSCRLRLNEQGSHAVHSFDPGSLCRRPGPHAVQFTFGVALYWPTPQAMHRMPRLVGVRAGLAFLTLVATIGALESSDSAGGAGAHWLRSSARAGTARWAAPGSANLPVHTTQAEPDEDTDAYLPAEQFPQAGDAIGRSEICPHGHSRHCTFGLSVRASSEPSYSSARNKPAAHASQDADPVSAVNCPAAQDTHARPGARGIQASGQLSQQLRCSCLDFVQVLESALRDSPAGQILSVTQIILPSFSYDDPSAPFR